MVQFNLLPDVKVAYLKAKRSKRLLLTIAISASAACLGLTTLLFIGVQVGQKQHINDLTKDIKAEVSKIQSVEDLDKILTIQNQLATLPQLHENKPLLSRLFTYIGQTTPSSVTISKLDIDMAVSTMTVSGSADSISTVNTYADTLKFATYDTESVKDTPAFQNITTTLTRDQGVASFDITMSFDPIIFNGTEKVTLVVPSIITTRSETEKPKALFDELNIEGDQ